jgi:Fe-S-cluster-containing dehydrogenase component
VALNTMFARRAQRSCANNAACPHPNRNLPPAGVPEFAGISIEKTFLRYGFVIDQNRCIGCHACTVACKEEHNVAVGVFRTWVKYIEKGSFPDVSRHFAVLRCNHCDNAPCVEICPTSALFRRPDGIVDFDNMRCIGCKSCMQACPYDALYIDPKTSTAAKCNYCAHRVETGLEPACVIVCPTQAIIAGDLDQPSSRIAGREGGDLSVDEIAWSGRPDGRGDPHHHDRP